MSGGSEIRRIACQETPKLFTSGSFVIAVANTARSNSQHTFHSAWSVPNVYLSLSLSLNIAKVMDFQTCYQYDPSSRKRDGPVKRRKIEPLQGLQTSWPLRRSLYQRLWAKQQARLKVCLFFPFPTDQSNKTRSYYSKSTNLPSVRFLLSSKPQTLSQPLAEYLRPSFLLVRALHHMPCYFRNFPTESVKRSKASLFL